MEREYTHWIVRYIYEVSPQKIHDTLPMHSLEYARNHFKYIRDTMSGHLRPLGIVKVTHRLENETLED